MSLDDLLGLTERLKERVKSHASLLQQNETRTRYALVDPLLKALGWDVEDPAQVTVEYTTGNNKRADYALLSEDGKPVLFIEVKKLGRLLTDGLSQSIGYCIEDGVQFFAVTDGATWEVYNTHKPVPIAQKRFTEFSLHKGVNEFVLGSLWLWRGNHTTGTPASSPMPAQPVQAPPPQPTLPPSPQPMTPPPGNEWVPLSGPPMKAGTVPPKTIRFPDGTQVAVKAWGNVPIEVIKWLLGKGILTPERCPVPLTNRRYLVSVQPVHPDGKGFRTGHKVDGLWVELNYIAPGQFRNAQFILKHLGQDPAQFSVRF